MRAAACTASLGASRAAPRSLRAVGTRRGVAVRVAASSQQTIPVTFTLKHKVGVQRGRAGAGRALAARQCAG